MDQRQGRWAVPPFLERAAAWSWRLVVVTGATYVVLWLVSQLQVVVIAVFIAIIAAAALDPVVSWMQRRRIPRLLATWIGLLVIGGVLVGVGFLFIPPSSMS